MVSFRSQLFKRSAYFYVTITRDFERFLYCTFEIRFRKIFLLFFKLEHRLLLESAITEDETFSYKTALSKANVKTNRMKSVKWTYRKRRSFATNHFLENLISTARKVCKYGVFSGP